MVSYQALQDRSAYRCGKLHRLLHPRTLSCESTVPLSNPVHRILLVGDSHADAIKSAFAAQAHATHTTVYFMVENTPLLKHGIRPKPLIEEAQRRAVNTLVLHYSPNSVEIAVLKQVVSLAQAAAIQVAFILPVPVWERAVPELLLRSLQAQAPLPIQTGADYLHTHQAFIADLNRLSAEQKLRLYPVVDIFCTPICQTLADSGRPLYFDRDHLTLTGSQRLVPLFIQLLADVH